MLQSLEEYIIDWHWTDVFQAFLPDGRTSRFSYGMGMLFGCLSTAAAFFGLKYLLNVSINAADTYVFIIMLSLSLLASIKILLSILLMLMLTIKRLHDINESGLWSCLLLMPALGVILITFLLVVPGYVFRNQYGASPA